jgi:hypothetical protein
MEAFGEALGGSRLAAAGLFKDTDVVAEGLVWERLSPIRLLPVNEPYIAATAISQTYHRIFHGYLLFLAL